MARYRFLKPFALTVLALTVKASLARASDTSDLQELLNESVVTTASKSAESESTAPATSTVISAEDIRRYGVRTLAEAIDFLSLSVASSPNAEGGEIGARGVLLSGDGGNHFLLLLNGHALNEQFAGSARFDRGAGIPLELVDHLEVIVGPGSVLYGSNAMLGVINIITKRAKDFSGTHLILESEVPSSVRAASGGGYSFSLFGVPSEVTLELEYYRQRGPDLFLRPQNVGIDPATGEPTRFSRTGMGTGVWGGSAHNIYEDTPSGFLRVLSGNVQLSLRAAADTQSRPTSPLAFDDPDNQRVERWASFDLSHHASVSSQIEVSTRLYGDIYDSQLSEVSPQVSLCRVPGVNCKFVQRGNARSVGAEVQGSFDWFQNARFMSIFGFDGRVRSVTSESRNYDAGTGVPLFGKYGTFSHNDLPFGAYVQQRWEPMPWLGFNGGVRVDRDERFPAVVSPRLAGSLKPWKGGVVRLIYAGAFRAPSWYETSYSEPVRILPDGLRPEKVSSLELSMEERFGEQRVFFGIFRSQWQDLIALQTLSPDERLNAIAQGKTDLDPTSSSPISQLRNVATVSNYGLNGAYEGTAVSGRFHYGLNATAAIASRDDGATGKQPLTVAPRLFGNARVAYDLPDGWPTVAIALRLLGQRSAKGAYDGYFNPPPIASSQLGLRTTATGALPRVRGLSYKLIVEYMLGSYQPYVIGPVQQATAANPYPNLLPVQKFQSTAGLQYDF